MEVNVLGIHSSPRKGATAHVLQKALSYAGEIDGVQTVYKELRHHKINYCLHCNRCITPGTFHCPVYDDGMTELYELVRKADVLVLATPVYQMAPTAIMHLFMNRLRPLGKLTSLGGWASKVGCGIAIGGTRNGGEETTLDVLNRFFLSQGMCIAGGGVYTYNGGSLWSHGRMGDDVLEDDIGLKTIAVAVRRAVITAKLIKQGLTKEDLLPVQLAGFKDQADRDEQVAAFFSHK